MLNKELIETRLAGLRTQQKEAATQAIMLEGAAQFCELLLKEIIQAAMQDTSHD